MSRAQKNWGWLSAVVAVLVAVAGWVYGAGRISANAATKDELKQSEAAAEARYATKESVHYLTKKTDEIGGDVKVLLQRTAPHHREAAP